MRFLQVWRDAILVGFTIMSVVVVGTSADLGAMEKPMLRPPPSLRRSRSNRVPVAPGVLFAFIFGLISTFIFPLILFLGRPRNPIRPRKLHLPPFIEFPLYGILSILWGACAHIGTLEWFPAFTGCHPGIDTAKTNLDISKTCMVLRTAHGTSWLIALGLCAVGLGVPGACFLYFLWKWGWTQTVWTPISEASFKTPRIAAVYPSRGEKEKLAREDLESPQQQHV